MDWPSERAAWGSFLDPNSTMITTAMIKIFHGLSNRSPIMSVLFNAGDVFSARVYTRPRASRSFRRSNRGSDGDKAT